MNNSLAAPIPFESLAALRPQMGQTSHGFAPDEVNELMMGVYERGDRIMQRCLLIHAFVALVLAACYGTWMMTMVVGGAAVAMFMISRALLPRAFVTRAIAGVSLQTFVALHIYELHGLPEMHFFFFTAFALMIVYQDWKCMWPGTILIIGQHIIFAVLHNTGVQLYFFEDPYVGFRKLFFHFGIALVHVGICGYWAHLKRSQTIEDAWRRALLREKQELLEKELTRSQSQAAELFETKKELETLLTEVHHRVKNNMQVVSSLLRLQSGSIKDPDVRALFVESQARIRSIALVHEKLYQGQSLSQIDFADYVKGLTAMLVRTYGPTHGGVKLEVHAESVFLDINTAIPAGLMLNELVTNCLKHAFPEARLGRIQVEVRPRTGEKGVELVVRDDGVGLPPGYVVGSGDSLGLRLVKSLSEQVRASLQYRNGTGTEFRILFGKPKDVAAVES